MKKPKVKITAKEAANEKQLKQDLKKLYRDFKFLIATPYLSTLPYYKEKLDELRRDVRELYNDASDGFATANRN